MSTDDTEQAALTEQEQETWRELHSKDFNDLSDAEKTSKIKLSVKRRFDYPEWVLMFEYGAPGSNGSVCDCLAVNTLPSRNYKVIGFEFKASRSDWLREKRDGQKADYFVRLADEFYVVAPKGVVEESEIPAGWGYLELKPNSEQLYKLQDSELTEHQQGEPGRRFWVRFLKQTVGDETNYNQSDLEEARSRGYQRGKEDGKKRGSTIEDRRIKKKAEKWDELEDAGLDWLYSIDNDRIQELKDARELLRMLTGDGYRSLRGEFEDLVTAVRKVQAPLQRLESRVDGDQPDVSGGEPE